jgi:hypothetical protein
MRSRICGTVERRIQKRVAAHVSFLFQHLADFLREVLAAMIENIGDVLYQHGKRLEGRRVVQIFLIKPRARIVTESLRMLIDFTQLRPAHPCESQTGWAAYDNVNAFSNRPELEFGRKVLRWSYRNIARLAVFGIAGMKVDPVRVRRVNVRLHRRLHRKTHRPKPEREAPASGKQVEHAGPSTAPQPGDFFYGLQFPWSAKGELGLVAVLIESVRI